MNIIYNSEKYYVLEYDGDHSYELVDKVGARGAFLRGDVADRFLHSMREAAAEDASPDNLDEFLGSIDVLFNLPLVVH